MNPFDGVSTSDLRFRARILRGSRLPHDRANYRLYIAELKRRHEFRTTIRVPAVFADDHMERGLPSGRELNSLSRFRYFKVTYEELEAWIADAEFYATTAWPSMSGVSRRVVASARRALPQLLRARVGV